MNALAARLQRAWAGRGALAWALWPLSLLMHGLVALRRLAYRRGWFPSMRLPVPVVIVGNLVAGGAGKTPTVLALVAALREAGHRPGIVSRGHGGQGRGLRAVTPASPAAEVGDEPLLLALRSRVPLWVGRDRAAAGLALLAHHPDTTVIVTDDGLQHLALSRDLQVVVFDERGVGNGWLLPAGPLREPLPGNLDGFGGVPTQVVYNAPTATTALPGTRGRARLAGALPLAQWWRGEPARPLVELPRRRWLAVAGMARPQRFFALLREAGLAFDECPLPDHHPYAELPWPAGVAGVLVTEKDAVKLDPGRAGTAEVWVLPLDFRLDPALPAWLNQQLGTPAPCPADLPAPGPIDGHPTA